MLVVLKKVQKELVGNLKPPPPVWTLIKMPPPVVELMGKVLSGPVLSQLAEIVKTVVPLLADCAFLSRRGRARRRRPAARANHRSALL